MKIGVRFGCASKRATLQDAKGPYAGSVGEQLRTSPTSKSLREAMRSESVESGNFLLGTEAGARPATSV